MYVCYIESQVQYVLCVIHVLFNCILGVTYTFVSDLVRIYF